MTSAPTRLNYRGMDRAEPCSSCSALGPSSRKATDDRLHLSREKLADGGNPRQRQLRLCSFKLFDTTTVGHGAAQQGQPRDGSRPVPVHKTAIFTVQLDFGAPGCFPGAGPLPLKSAIKAGPGGPGAGSRPLGTAPARQVPRLMAIRSLKLGRPPMAYLSRV